MLLVRKKLCPLWEGAQFFTLWFFLYPYKQYDERE